jgi:hypothetical protein
VNYTLNGIYSFKISSGEEIVAKVTQVGENYVVLNNPASVAPGPQGVGLIPTLFTADISTEIRLNTNAVVLVSKTDPSVKAKYIEATTGIVVPDKKIIMG